MPRLHAWHSMPRTLLVVWLWSTGKALRGLSLARPHTAHTNPCDSNSRLYSCMLIPKVDSNFLLLQCSLLFLRHCLFLSYRHVLQ